MCDIVSEVDEERKLKANKRWMRNFITPTSERCIVAHHCKPIRSGWCWVSGFRQVQVCSRKVHRSLMTFAWSACVHDGNRAIPSYFKQASIFKTHLDSIEVLKVETSLHGQCYVILWARNMSHTMSVAAAALFVSCSAQYALQSVGPYCDQKSSSPFST
jgi:hypothetical protein